MHTQFDLRGNISVFIHFSKASVHDVKAMDEICIEICAIYWMNKGHIDFFRLFNTIHKNSAFFVTNANENMQYEFISSKAVDLQTGVINYQNIRLTEEVSAQKYPDEYRLDVFEYFSPENVYHFITKHTGYEAFTIAELYRERWNVELFFKWIKQHLHIKLLYGTSENVVYTQIWIDVCAYCFYNWPRKGCTSKILNFI